MRSLLVSLAVTLAAAGCSHFVPWADFDSMESVNVALPTGAWPEGFDLTPAQQEIFDARGRPDHFRARWDRRGRLMWGDEVRQRSNRQRVVDVMARAYHRDEALPFEMSWIYQDSSQGRQRTGDMDIFRGEEVIFTGDNDYDVEPVSDQLGVVIDNGDPEERREPQTSSGHTEESWVYFHEGRVFHFIDGHMVRVEHLPPMPVRVRPEI
jgi:hypothetical protein